jgi:hypothetical protein
VLYNKNKKRFFMTKYTFGGVDSDDWSNPNNWSPVGVPDSQADLAIINNVSNLIVNGPLTCKSQVSGNNSTIVMEPGKGTISMPNAQFQGGSLGFESPYNGTPGTTVQSIVSPSELRVSAGCLQVDTLILSESSTTSVVLGAPGLGYPGNIAAISATNATLAGTLVLSPETGFLENTPIPIITATTLNGAFSSIEVGFDGYELAYQQTTTELIVTLAPIICPAYAVLVGDTCTCPQLATLENNQCTCSNTSKPPVNGCCVSGQTTFVNGVSRCASGDSLINGVCCEPGQIVRNGTCVN